jgi:hypothetical protein
MDTRVNVKVDPITRDILRMIIADWQKNGLPVEDGTVKIVGKITYDAALREIIRHSTVVGPFFKKRLSGKIRPIPPIIAIRPSSKGSFVKKRT